MRRSLGVVGLQDGDEGKGKIADYIVSQMAQRVWLSSAIGPLLPQKPIVVRRFQGGANAGHTVVIDDPEGREHTYKLHQIPSGIITEEAYNLAGKGMYINPRKLVKEVLELQADGVDVTPENFGIAANAHVTLDYHIIDDLPALQRKKHTATGNGIKQTAADKYARRGLRFIEFLDPQLMAEILKENRFPKGLPKRYGTSFEKLVDSYDAEREILAPFIVQEQEVMKYHGTLFGLDEGANGVFLDIDDGLYNGTTSSHPSRVPRETQTLVGVFKLYKSSVGTGARPFVSRISDLKLEAVFRDATGERGTTTGKDRELGWFDIPAARYALDVTNVEHIVGTRGDSLEILAKLGAKPKICIAYDIGGKKYDSWDVSFFRRDTLYKAKPVLEEFEPWKKFVEEDGITLTTNAACYVRRIEELLGKYFSILGCGQKRGEIIVYDEIL